MGAGVAGDLSPQGFAAPEGHPEVQRKVQEVQGALERLAERSPAHARLLRGEVRGQGKVVGSLASLGPQAPGVRVAFRPGLPPPGWPRWSGGVLARPLSVEPWR